MCVLVWAGKERAQIDRVKGGCERREKRDNSTHKSLAMEARASFLPQYTSLPVLSSSGTPVVFYTCSYNPARRLRIEKLLYIELSRISNGYFKPLLDPGGGFNSETAARRFQN
jgi:hypothetical protein